MPFLPKAASIAANSSVVSALGGYDPKKAGDYANRINYSALVIRRSF